MCNYKTRLALVCPVPPTNHTGDVGRPRFIIPREQLQYLIEAQFSVPHISRLEFLHGLYTGGWQNMDCPFETHFLT